MMGAPQERQPGTGIRSALRNGSFQSLTNLYYVFIRGIYILVFAQIIGIELYGYYVYSQNWYVLILPLAAWGMNELLMAEYIRFVDDFNGPTASGRQPV